MRNLSWILLDPFGGGGSGEVGSSNPTTTQATTNDEVAVQGGTGPQATVGAANTGTNTIANGGVSIGYGNNNNHITIQDTDPAVVAEALSAVVTTANSASHVATTAITNGQMTTNEALTALQQAQTSNAVIANNALAAGTGTAGQPVYADTGSTDTYSFSKSDISLWLSIAGAVVFILLLVFRKK